MKRITVLLAEDHMIVRQGLKRAAHDCTADVEDGAELFLGQFRAWGQPLVDDSIEYATVDRSDAAALAGAGSLERRRGRRLGIHPGHHVANVA